MISPLYIKTFLSLVETRHFTQTADLLNMTQPGVSQHIKKLENELNVSLFHRQGKTIELTPQGEVFLVFALKQQEDEATLRDQLLEDSPYEGECKIACSGSMAMQLYPALLQLQSKHTDLLMSVEAAPDDRVVNLVKGNEVGLGLVTRHIDDPELVISEVGYEELCLVLPKGQKATWENLMRLGYIDHPNGAHYANQVFEANYWDDFTGFKNMPKASYVNQLNQILLPVAAGLGFTVLPDTTVKMFQGQEAIQLEKLAKPCREMVFLIMKKHKPLPKRYNLVEGVIERCVSTSV